MSTFAGKDNCTDLILDFISKGESGGNYNAVIGDARATADLGKLSLRDISALQDQLEAAGKPSTAVGRYQIIRATLTGLQATMKMGMDALFTPELQDKMAVALMVGRGYSHWWTGALTNEDFAHGLSMEWASLPDPRNGGKSHYDGVGANHASTTLPAVYAMLDRAKSAMPAPPPVVPAPPPAPPVVVVASDGRVTITTTPAVALLISHLLRDHIADVTKAIADLSGGTKA